MKQKTKRSGSLSLYSSREKLVATAVTAKRSLVDTVSIIQQGNDDQTEILHVPFHTHDSVSLCDDANPLPYNDRFDLRFYLPVNGRKPKRLFIMINGFAEGKTTFWDHLGGSFVRAGFAAVLFPLPMHFSRHPLFNINDYHPADSYQITGGRENLALYTSSLRFGLVNNPHYAVHFNRQMMKDVGVLVRGLRSAGNFSMESIERVVEGRFSGEVECSIIGFSLGGLCALQAFLSGPKDFNACILVNSGASFQDMNASHVFQDDWDDLQIGLLRKSRELHSSMAPHFERVFLGHEKLELHSDLRDNVDKILLVLGGSDPIINLRNILNLEPKDSGLALFQIPKLPHFINANAPAFTRWREYSEMVIRLAVAFDEFRPKNSDAPEAKLKADRAQPGAAPVGDAAGWL